MDEAHLIAAARYAALNPVRARLAARAEDWPQNWPQNWPWSSVRAHLPGEDDGLAAVRPLLDRIGDFAELLRTESGEEKFKALHAAGTTGRPLGNEAFVADLERRLGRRLARGRPGPTPNQRSAPEQGDLWG